MDRVLLYPIHMFDTDAGPVGLLAGETDFDTGFRGCQTMTSMLGSS